MTGRRSRSATKEKNDDGSKSERTMLETGWKSVTVEMDGQHFSSRRAQLSDLKKTEKKRLNSMSIWRLSIKGIQSNCCCKIQCKSFVLNWHESVVRQLRSIYRCCCGESCDETRMSSSCHDNQSDFRFFVESGSVLERCSSIAIIGMCAWHSRSLHCESYVNLPRGIMREATTHDRRRRGWGCQKVKKLKTNALGGLTALRVRAALMSPQSSLRLRRSVRVLEAIKPMLRSLSDHAIDVRCAERWRHPSTAVGIPETLASSFSRPM